MSESIYEATNRIYGARQFMRWAFNQWLKHAMPIVKKKIEEERAKESVYVRAWYLSREA